MMKSTRRVISRVGLRKAMEKDFNRFMIRAMSLGGRYEPFPTDSVEEFIVRVMRRFARKAGEE